MTRTRLAAAGALAVAVGLALAPGCRSPTDVRLVVRSLDLQCPVLLGGGEISISVGPHGQVDETTTPVTETVDCSAHAGGGYIADVGDLALIPHHDDTASFDVLVVAHTPTGDIVQSRAVTYVASTELQLLTYLSAACINVKCDVHNSTCHPVTGQCVPNAVVCDADVCALPGEVPGTGDASAPPDTGADTSMSTMPDATHPQDSASGDGTTEAAPTDGEAEGQSSETGPGDASLDAPPAEGGGTDSALPPPDSGGPPLDASSPDSSGPPADASSPDSGAPPDDASMNDSGSPPMDSSAPDTFQPPMDSSAPDIFVPDTGSPPDGSVGDSSIEDVIGPPDGGGIVCENSGCQDN